MQLLIGLLRGTEKLKYRNVMDTGNDSILWWNQKQKPKVCEFSNVHYILYIKTLMT